MAGNARVQGGSGREVSCGRWNLIHPPKHGQDLNKYEQRGGYSLSRQGRDLKPGESSAGDTTNQPDRVPFRIGSTACHRTGSKDGGLTEIAYFSLF